MVEKVILPHVVREWLFWGDIAVVGTYMVYEFIRESLRKK